MGFEPTASTLRRSNNIGRNEPADYIKIIELKGLCDKHIYETTRFLKHYLKFINNKIDKSKSIEYFRILKDRYSTSSYRKQVYQILKFLRYIKVDWTEEIKLPPEPNYYPYKISKEVINNTLLYFENRDCYIRLKALILLGYTSGVRAEELYQLNMDDIDLNNRVVHINHNLKNGQSTKNKKNRVSFFTKETKQVLSDYLIYFNKNSNLKTLFSQGRMERLFRDAPIKVKDLRKAFSQEWTRRNGSSSVKKILMGHSLRNDVDLCHYNCQSEEDLKRIYDKVMRGQCSR